MALSVQGYRGIWQQESNKWWDANIVTSEACVFFELGDGPTVCNAFADFGHAICYYRYLQTAEDQLPLSEETSELFDFAPMLAGLKGVHERFNPSAGRLSREKVLALWQETERELDTLLVEFVEQGYRPEMSERLRTIVNNSVTPWLLEKIFILPDDLEAVLEFVGNPLINEDDYETEEEAKAHAPAFDLDNPEHRDALGERICEIGQ